MLYDNKSPHGIRRETIEAMNVHCQDHYGKSYLQVVVEQKGSVLRSIEEINKDRELPSMELLSR